MLPKFCKKKSSKKVHFKICCFSRLFTFSLNLKQCQLSMSMCQLSVSCTKKKRPEEMWLIYLREFMADINKPASGIVATARGAVVREAHTAVDSKEQTKSPFCLVTRSVFVSDHSSCKGAHSLLSKELFNFICSWLTEICGQLVHLLCIFSDKNARSDDLNYWSHLKQNEALALL